MAAVVRDHMSRQLPRGFLIREFLEDGPPETRGRSRSARSPSPARPLIPRTPPPRPAPEEPSGSPKRPAEEGEDAGAVSYTHLRAHETSAHL
eukprot:4918351-Alexandrium_andersonii.AAC.1